MNEVVGADEATELRYLRRKVITVFETHAAERREEKGKGGRGKGREDYPGERVGCGSRQVVATIHHTRLTSPTHTNEI